MSKKSLPFDHGDNDRDCHLLPAPNPFYVAMCGDEYVESAASLKTLTDSLDEICEGTNNEDIVIWCGPRVIAVRLADGLTLWVDHGSSAKP